MNPAEWPVIIKAAILGAVEGITEFIPVSSTGHLILAGEWLRFTGPTAATFDIFIQLGAIMAIVWIYRARFLGVALGLTHQSNSRKFIGNLGLAFLPAAIVGLLSHDFIKATLFNPLTVAGALAVGGIIILALEAKPRKPRISEVDEMSWRLALGIGLAQVLSLFPGVSRSGATIMGGFALGMSRPAATEFSFFLAVPVMFAASSFELISNLDALSRADLPVFAIGFLVSFLSAMAVVKVFIRLVARHDFRGFAWYRIFLGIALLAWQLTEHGTP